MSVAKSSITAIATQGWWVDHAPEDEVLDGTPYADNTRLGTLDSYVEPVESVGLFLTDARKTLLARLQANTTLDSEVSTWFDWGSGIRKRYNLEPATCPLVSVVPADLDTDERQDTNVSDLYPQMLEVGVATAGQDAEPCERLVAACLDVIRAANVDCMGLSSDGLNSVRLAGTSFGAQQRKEGKRIVWLAALTVRLAWRL